MTRNSRLSTFLQPLLLSGALVLFSANVTADFDSAGYAFEDCIYAHLPNEKSKSEPKLEALLNACKAEWLDIMRQVPPGVENDIDHFIRQQVTRVLNAE